MFRRVPFKRKRRRLNAVGHVVTVHKRVAVMRMESLSVRLFFGFLEAYRLDLVSRTDAAEETVAGLHSFHSFISSAGHVFSLTTADSPARSVSEICSDWIFRISGF